MSFTDTLFMFDQTQAESLCKQRLWYDLCQYLILHSFEYSEESYYCFIKYILPNFRSIHPVTLTKVAIKIVDNVKIEDGQKIIDECLNYLKNVDFPTNEHSNAIFKLTTKYYTIKLYEQLNGCKEGGVAEIERFIFENKNKKMDKENYNLLYNLSYLLYELLNNQEELYFYINKYLIYYEKLQSKFLEPENILAEKLLKSALLSKEVYSFQGIINNKFYKFVENNDLKNLFEKISQGDIDFVINNKNSIEKMFGNYEFLKEKTFLIAFVNVCFYSEKEVHFKDFQIKLGLQRDEVLYVAMMAMGKKLIKGYIDGENEVINIKYVVPRILNEDDLIEVRNKYENWRRKIVEVIDLV